jgi:hypothetical protein
LAAIFDSLAATWISRIALHRDTLLYYLIVKKALGFMVKSVKIVRIVKIVTTCTGTARRP